MSQSTIFQLCQVGSSWFEPVLSKDYCVLLNAVTPVRLNPQPLDIESSTLPLSQIALQVASRQPGGEPPGCFDAIYNAILYVNQCNHDRPNRSMRSYKCTLGVLYGWFTLHGLLIGLMLYIPINNFSVILDFSGLN